MLLGEKSLRIEQTTFLSKDILFVISIYKVLQIMVVINRLINITKSEYKSW